MDAMTLIVLAVIGPRVSPLPADMREYAPAVYTQSISTLNERPHMRLVRIKELDAKWTVSGGMTPTTAFSSRKYRRVGYEPTYAVQRVSVKNSLGYYQRELGLTRTYPNGARFDDVLRNQTGVVFEHRSRAKADGVWTASVIYRNVPARPKGYTGLTVSCASCHNDAGTGGYGTGLVPGGDTVLSDPLDWTVVNPAYMGDR